MTVSTVSAKTLRTGFNPVLTGTFYFKRLRLEGTWGPAELVPQRKLSFVPLKHQY